MEKFSLWKEHRDRPPASLPTPLAAPRPRGVDLRPRLIFGLCWGGDLRHLVQHLHPRERRLLQPPKLRAHRRMLLVPFSLRFLPFLPAPPIAVASRTAPRWWRGPLPTTPPSAPQCSPRSLRTTSDHFHYSPKKLRYFPGRTQLHRRLPARQMAGVHRLHLLRGHLLLPRFFSRHLLLPPPATRAVRFATGQSARTFARRYSAASR
mmetsp:Transcript_25502/g.64283  ORF Transcript_25502/g.64283 Transcript_25502/m.64283 type:complete len:206 (-) Transcript_25502:665-1282(-)